jgi:hypothetical protein
MIPDVGSSTFFNKHDLAFIFGFAGDNGKEPHGWLIANDIVVKSGTKEAQHLPLFSQLDFGKLNFRRDPCRCLALLISNLH